MIPPTFVQFQRMTEDLQTRLQAPEGQRRNRFGGSPKFQAKYLSANIAKFHELKKLLLFNLRLKDEDLSHLAKLPKLEELDLSANPNLTDATLAVLAQLPSLKKVNLEGVKDITPAGVRALRDARPSLSIAYD